MLELRTFSEPGVLHIETHRQARYKPIYNDET